MSRRKTYSQGYQQAVRDRENFESEQRCPDGDPGEVTEYFEHEAEYMFWRQYHKVHRDPGGITPRCPRCFSTKVARVTNAFGVEVLYCRGCRLSEPVIDFPQYVPQSGLEPVSICLTEADIAYLKSK